MADSGKTDVSCVSVCLASKETWCSAVTYTEYCNNDELTFPFEIRKTSRETQKVNH